MLYDCCGSTFLFRTGRRPVDLYQPEPLAGRAQLQRQWTARSGVPCAGAVGAVRERELNVYAVPADSHVARELAGGGGGAPYPAVDARPAESERRSPETETRPRGGPRDANLVLASAS